MRCSCAEPGSAAAAALARSKSPRTAAAAANQGMRLGRAGVATLGLSFLAKGMWDRVTADKKVCKEALEEVERRTAQKTP